MREIILREIKIARPKSCLARWRPHTKKETLLTEKVRHSGCLKLRRKTTRKLWRMIWWGKRLQLDEFLFESHSMMTQNVVRMIYLAGKFLFSSPPCLSPMPSEGLWAHWAKKGLLPQAAMDPGGWFGADSSSAQAAAQEEWLRRHFLTPLRVTSRLLVLNFLSGSAHVLKKTDHVSCSPHWGCLGLNWTRSNQINLYWCCVLSMGCQSGLGQGITLCTFSSVCFLYMFLHLRHEAAAAVRVCLSVCPSVMYCLSGADV